MSSHTVAAYKHDLLTLTAFSAGRGIKRWCALDNSLVRAFAATEHAGGIAPRSIQRRLSAVRSFYEFLLREGVAKNNPAQEVRAPKTKKRLPTTLDADQMARLLDFRADDSLSSRDKAIMELFYSSGLRLSELVELDLSQLDIADRTVRVTGKGNKTRIVPVGRHAIEALKKWLVARRPGPVGSGRSASRRNLGAPPGVANACASSHVSPLVRLAPARIQRGLARRSGIAGSRRHQHHADLYSPGFPAPGPSLRRDAPPGPAPTPQRLKETRSAPR
jgi:integrase